MLCSVKIATLLVSAFILNASLDNAPVYASDEKPFFSVDQNGNGPLTMSELQINIPSAIDKQLSDVQRSCVIKAIERLANEAGDPETLNPANVAYLPDQESWSQLNSSSKRIILAQAITSRSFAVC